MKKINVAEILKDCPKGMELDCTMFDNVTFVEVDAEKDFPIEIEVNSICKYYLTKEGCYHRPGRFNLSAKCVIFPKGKTTWEGFVPPCKFKDGDVISNSSLGTCIFKGGGTTEGTVDYYCCVFGDYLIHKQNPDVRFGNINIVDCRFATEEEKEELFQAIKEHGYKWNEETKTLEKRLIEKPKFENGDIIFTHCDSGHTWISIFKKNEDGKVETYADYYSDANNDDLNYYHINNDNYYLCIEEDIVTQRLATEEEKQKLFKAIGGDGYKWNAETKTLERLLVVKPKFKVGDKIKNKRTGTKITVNKIHQDCYECDLRYALTFENQNNWELVPDKVSNKFDINTLVPFESRVLMRSTDAREWVATFYSHYSNNKFYGCGMCCDQCIPYEGNEHLLGTTNDCSEYFKTWKD